MNDAPPGCCSGGRPGRHRGSAAQPTEAVARVHAALEAPDGHQQVELEVARQLAAVQAQQEAGAAAQVAAQRCGGGGAAQRQRGGARLQGARGASAAHLWPATPGRR
jgi:hypothetical protein